MRFDEVEVAGIAEQEGAARDWLPEQFVKIDGERISGFNARKLLAMLAGK